MWLLQEIGSSEWGVNVQTPTPISGFTGHTETWMTVNASSQRTLEAGVREDEAGGSAHALVLATAASLLVEHLAAFLVHFNK